MALKDMLEALKEEGARQCREIISQAEVQAAKIVEEAKEEAEEIRKEEVEKVKSVIQVDRNKLINEARLGVKREIIQAKEEFIQQTFLEAEKRVQKFKSSPDYQKSLGRMVEEVLEEIPDSKILVSVEKKDEKVARQILDQRDIKHEFVKSLNSSGGIKITSEDGRISLTNTFEIRLEKAKKLLKSDIMNILFS